MRTLYGLWHDEAGVVQAETAILVAFVALAGIGLWQHISDATTSLAGETSQVFENGDESSLRPLAHPAGTDATRPR